MSPLLLLPAVLWPALAPDPTEEAVRAAVSRALPLLEAGTAGYLEHRDCFSCHHQAVPVIALDLARRRGFAVDEANIEAQLDLTADDLASALDDYRAGRGQGGGATRAGYALWTLAVGGREPDETTAAVAGFLLGRDAGRGHWRTSSDRPPTEASPFTTTAVALRGLLAYAEPDRRADRVAAARSWLEGAEPEDHEERVFRLWGLHLAGSGPEAVREAVRAIRDRQRADGGWSQLDGGRSDAYATASALVALHQAGGVGADDPAYRRGLAYLLATQRADGSWHVASRSRPFQAYFESGFPHGPDQFLSMAASGWAASALLLALPPADPR